MMKNIVRILDIQQVTHNVKCFKLEKPAGYHFLPGQATDVSINIPGMEEEVRPFTFTALVSEPYLEFTIKGYYDHEGVTNKLHQLKVGDELILADAWGAIGYKGAGYFIAGGAGITPFMAILRELHKENKLSGNQLFFSNKTAADIIYEQELKSMLGDQVVFILSGENKEGYLNGHIDEAFIKENMTVLDKEFYVCGPDQMVADVNAHLEKLGVKADSLAFEK